MFRVEGKGPLRFLSFDESMRRASRPVRSWVTDSTDAESAGLGGLVSSHRPCQVFCNNCLRDPPDHGWGLRRLTERWLEFGPACRRALRWDSQAGLEPTNFDFRLDSY